MSIPSAEAAAYRRRFIGGVAGHGEASTRLRLAAKLGEQARILGDEPDALVSDFDACWADGVRVRSSDWRGLVHRLETVSGSFAIAWREIDGSVCLARDPIGERTLYYALVDSGLVFASKLQATLAAGVPLTLDISALASYLSYAYVPGSITPVRGVHELLPGQIVRWRRGDLTSSWFWELPAEAAADEAPDEMALSRRLRGVLERAVQERLPQNEPVGAFLSGGLDSSLVVALASRLHGHPIHTYSVSFGAEHRNELPFSSLVAEHCGTRHRVVEISARDVADHFDAAAALLDVPNGDPLTVPNLLLFREASRDVGVVLNGEGGDPCFGGPKNLPMLLAELFGDAESDDEQAHARERTYLRAHQKCFDELASILDADAFASVGSALESELVAWFADARWRTFVTKLMAINVRFKGAHHILPKVDALSAPFGVMARSPLFARSVVEMAFTIPPQLKLRGSVEKYILKRAVEDVLPTAIIERPKSGMLVPVQGWFQGPLLDFARERLLGSKRTGLFRRAYVEQLLNGRLPGLHPRRGVKIWLLLTFESWLRSLRP